MICDDYTGPAWDVVNDACWQAATATDKLDFLVRAAFLASVAASFIVGFLVMKK